MQGAEDTILLDYALQFFQGDFDTVLVFLLRGVNLLVYYYLMFRHTFIKHRPKYEMLIIPYLFTLLAYLRYQTEKV